ARPAGSRATGSARPLPAAAVAHRSRDRRIPCPPGDASSPASSDSPVAAVPWRNGMGCAGQRPGSPCPAARIAPQVGGVVGVPERSYWHVLVRVLHGHALVRPTHGDPVRFWSRAVPWPAPPQSESAHPAVAGSAGPLGLLERR